MKLNLTLLLLVLLRVATAQNFKEKDLKTEIREVTVFLGSAQIFESGTVPLSAGKTILRIKDLSSYLDDKSIQVKGDGDFTILSVNHKLNYLSAFTRDKKIDSLHQILDAIEGANTKENARLSVLNEKYSVLSANKSIGGVNNGVSIAQLQQALTLYETEIVAIKAEEIEIKKSMEVKKKNSERITQQLKELNDATVQPTSEIEIRVDADAAVTAKFRITYLVGNAGWFPKYDIRVRDIKTPLEITYKAEVFQNTGVDWKNVKLRFSNGDPNQSGTAPTLKTWNLSFARLTTYHSDAAIYGSRAMNAGTIRQVRGKVVDANGEAMPGVNVVVKGSTNGTTTDAGGNYSIALPGGLSTLYFSFVGYNAHEVQVVQPEVNVTLNEDVTALSEVVVTGYGSALQGMTSGVRIRGASSYRANAYKPESRLIPTTTIENQTTVEIEVAQPYSIRSNGEKLMVDLKKIQAEALYEYYALPKLDKDAFLIARIIKWDQYNLLEGEANLYFEDAYVGRSILNAKSLEDTLDISLGRDKNIVIGREKKEEFSKRRSIGGHLVETRAFEILVRNKKSQPVKITIFDQIPVSIVSDITVSAEELSGARHEEQSGKITWELLIQPQQQKELNLQYEVRYPKKERVLLE
jgi:hypothetical protein